MSKIKVYTDAAFSPSKGHAGCSYAIIQNGRFIYGENTLQENVKNSVSSELISARKAIEKCSEIKIGSFEINTDSEIVERLHPPYSWTPKPETFVCVGIQVNIRSCSIA